MATRALPDLIARIRVDSSGVDSAMSNMVSSFGRTNLALAGVGVGLGVLIMGAKSMIDISEKHQAAVLGLTQAVEAHNAAIGQNVTATRDVTKEVNAHNAAVLALEKMELGLQGHKATALQLFDLNLAHQKVAETAAALAAAEKPVGTAIDQVGINLTDYQLKIQAFITANRQYISDQSEVIDGYAKLTRSGLSQNEVQRAMNDAVDLAAIKHISLTDAVALLDNAEHGRLRGLIDLGITSAKYVDSAGNVIDANHNMAKVMAELESKTKGGRDTLTDLQKESNDLSNSWQKISIDGGPALLKIMDQVLRKGDDVIAKLLQIGSTDYTANWGNLQNSLIDVGNWIKTYLIDPLEAAYGWLYALENQGAAPGSATDPSAYGASFSSSAHNRASNTPHGYGKAAGGPVLPNSIYTVGESGPETLVMGSSGGTVIPNRGSTPGGGATTNVYVTVQGSVKTERDLVLGIREGIRRADREQR